MPDRGQPWRLTKSGLVLAVRVTPKSARDEVRGLAPTPDGLALAITVRAIPAKGEANAATLAVLAKWLGLPKGRLDLSGGGKSRAKSVTIEGNPLELDRLLNNITK